MPDILCIGHAAYDINVFVRAFPAENSKVETDLVLEAGGGPAANAAYLLSSWGVACGFAGVVGDDLYGQRIMAEFQSVGTGISLVERRPDYRTPLSIVVVNLQNGSRTLVNRKLPQTALTLLSQALAGMSPAVLLFDGHELDASLAALQAFPNARTILDAGSLREGTAALAGKVNYLVASEKFALQVCGLPELDTPKSRRACVRQLRHRYNNVVVVTLGERGLIADDGNGYCGLPAFQAMAVDTTAAGDIFHGAFAYGVAQEMTFKETLRFASMTASLSVRKRGGRLSMPSLIEVRKALMHAK